MGQYTGKYPRNWLNPFTDIPPYLHTHRRPGKEDNWNSNVAGLSNAIYQKMFCLFLVRRIVFRILQLSSMKMLL